MIVAQHQQQQQQVSILGGFCAPIPRPLTHMQDDIVKGQADANRSGTSRFILELNAARSIQRMARGFLTRRQYLKYKCFVQLDSGLIASRRQAMSAVHMQRTARGFLARRQFKKLRHLDEERRREEFSKKGKKAPPPKKGVVAAPPPPPDLSQVPVPSDETLRGYRELALVRNSPFIAICRQLHEERLDEAMTAVDQLLKTSAEVMLQRMQLVIQKKKNISLGLPANSPPVAAAGGAAKKKK